MTHTPAELEAMGWADWLENLPGTSKGHDAPKVHALAALVRRLQARLESAEKVVSAGWKMHYSGYDEDEMSAFQIALAAHEQAQENA